ncbi:MAG: hypothetical protein UY48_C0008G0007 [Candidatus Gottesmanbacteria bacterium GW2011_GWB1_49_7]|uniref:Antirestriction protein ArdA n=1 Tax=Candidatus Gottesmanbacteria bacterium GW2011_GWB1_49_7 TaxID=1618448 RepID=A0A0G1YCZ7_9BACT|nr:MAG: hypothetical protein UY48_C0008G0007 [Candidatus Gottesmanbacteria bacterium GW2011_GWB1_49_7]
MNKIKIFASCLGCYNAGRLTGRWLDLPTESPISEAVTKIMAEIDHEPGCSKEEWFVSDSEGPVKVPEYCSPYELRALDDLAQLMEDDEEAAHKVIYLYKQYGEQDLRKALDEGLDRVEYRPGQTLKELAEEILKERVDTLRSFLKQHAYGRELEAYSGLLADLESRYDVDGLAHDLDLEGYDEQPDGVYYSY